MKIMAVDYGEKRTGIAVSDSGGILASPVGCIAAKSEQAAVAQIAEKAKELRAELIVVGQPLNMDGSAGKSAMTCRRIAEELKRLLTIEVVLWDERLSTKSATHYMNETDTRGKKRKANMDALAATIILQSYLDYLKGKR